MRHPQGFCGVGHCSTCVATLYHLVLPNPQGCGQVFWRGTASERPLVLCDPYHLCGACGPMEADSAERLETRFKVMDADWSAFEDPGLRYAWLDEFAHTARGIDVLVQLVRGPITEHSEDAKRIARAHYDAYQKIEPVLAELGERGKMIQLLLGM